MAYVLPAMSHVGFNSGGFFAAVFARLRGVLLRNSPKRPPARVRQMVAAAQPQPLAMSNQWAKLNDILGRAAGGAAAAAELQGAATRQLDLAQYGLTTLVDELSAVMTIPGRMSRKATLHVLGAGSDAKAEAGFSASNAHALAA